MSVSRINNTTANNISVNNSSFKVLTATNQQSINSQNDDALYRARATGILNGGVVTGIGTTTITYTGGQGDIRNESTSTYTPVNWSSGTLTGYSTNGLYYLYVNNLGVVATTTTQPSHADYRDFIWLCRISVTGNIITAINDITMPVGQYSAGIWDIFRAVGLIKRDLLISPNGINLNLNISSGGIYQAGINFHIDPKSPHQALFNSQNAFIFRMATQTGTIASDVTILPVGSYDVNGVVTTIPGGGSTSTIFTVLRFPQGNIRILYGQATYSSLANAQSAIGTYTPILPAGYSEAIIIGYIAVTKSAISLNNILQAFFLNTNKFGGVGDAIGGVLGNYLQTTNNLSDLSSISTARTNLGVSYVLFTQNTQSLAVSTTETTLASYTLPAGLMSVNSSIRVTLDFSATNNANNKTIRMNFGGVNIFTTSGINANTALSMQRTISNRNSLTNQVALGNTSVSYSTTGITTPYPVFNVNTANSVVINITGTKAVDTDVLALERILIEILP